MESYNIKETMKLNLLHNRGYEKFYQRDNTGKNLLALKNYI